MYGHRSIVRIKRNPSRERSINICLIIISYIFINLIFSDYWLYINGAVLICILSFCFFYYCCFSNYDETDIEINMNSENISYSSDNDNISIDSDTSLPTVIAVPISPSGLNSNRYIVEINATQL